MRYKKHIKNISGTFITCLFLIAISPKQYIHFLFAKHKDSTEKVIRAQGTTLSIAGYNCNVDQLVAEPNFENPLTENQSSTDINLSSFSDNQSSLYFTKTAKSKDRGPPNRL